MLFDRPCAMGDNGIPMSLANCTLKAPEHSDIHFGSGRLVEIDGNPVYYHYNVFPVQWESEQYEIQRGVQGEAKEIGNVTFVPVGQALGNFKCTVYSSMLLRSLTQTPEHNVYDMNTKITQKFCSTIQGDEELPLIHYSKAQLICPRSDNKPMRGLCFSGE